MFGRLVVFKGVTFFMGKGGGVSGLTCLSNPPLYLLSVKHQE